MLMQRDCTDVLMVNLDLSPQIGHTQSHRHQWPRAKIPGSLDPITPGRPWRQVPTFPTQASIECVQSASTILNPRTGSETGAS